MDNEGEAGKVVLPRFALVQRGTRKVKGRVLCYEGNDYFTVLLPGDIRLYAHRDRLIFTNN